MADTTLPGLMGTGDHASRPAASAVGSGGLYACSTHGLVYQTDGSTWSTWLTAGSVSAGSNATRVSETSGAGVGPTYSYSDHRHDGIGQITSSSSNTLQRGTVNLRAGAGAALTATDTDGDGEFDTVTISATGSSGGGSSALAGGATIQNSGTNYTTTSSSFADIDATNLSVTITTGAHRVKVTLTCLLANSSATEVGVIDVVIDGTRQGDTANGSWQHRNNSNGAVTWCWTFVSSVLTAASHTVKLQWKVSAGATFTMYRNAVQPIIYLVEELPF